MGKTLGTPYQVAGCRVQLVREGPAMLASGATPVAIADLVRAHLGDTDREQFVAVLLNVRLKVLAINTVSVGTLSQSLVHPREVFKPAILAGAHAVIVAHNHPSGDPEPSVEDMQITRRLAAAGTLLGIEVVDHVIVAEDSHVSLRERGAL
jgi:DNA repair protein RadC